jgi:hypothetical protein
MQSCFSSNSLGWIVGEHSFQQVQAKQVKVEPVDDCLDWILRVVGEGCPVVS